MPWTYCILRKGLMRYCKDLKHDWDQTRWNDTDFFPFFWLDRYRCASSLVSSTYLDCNHYSLRFYLINKKKLRAARLEFYTYLCRNMFSLLKFLFFLTFSDDDFFFFPSAEFEPPNKFSGVRCDLFTWASMQSGPDRLTRLDVNVSSAPLCYLSGFFLIPMQTLNSM